MEEANNVQLEEISLIEEKVKKYEIESALTDLSELSKTIYGGQFQIEAHLLESRYNRMKKSGRMGVWDFDNLNIEQNRLVLDVLTLLHIIRDEHKAEKQIEILQQNQNEIANLKSILTEINVEVAKETIARLGECWSEIYQFERDFKKINNEFVFHYLNQDTNNAKLDDLSQLELEINSLFPIPPEPIKSKTDISERETCRESINEVLMNAYNNENHEVSSKEHEYFLLKFQKLFEKFEVPDTTLEKNKFWLPRELYLYAREYHNCYLRFLFYFKREEYGESHKCLINMETEKGHVEDIVLNLGINFSGKKPSG